MILAFARLVAGGKPDYFPLRDGRAWRYAATGYEVAGTDTVMMDRLTCATTLSGSGTAVSLGKACAVRVTRDAAHSVSFAGLARADSSVPAGTFRNCFRTRMHASEPYVMDFRFAPNVGIVPGQRRFSRNRFETARLRVESPLPLSSLPRGA